MSNPFKKKTWSPCVVGAFIGILSWLAFASADNPLGVTTAFEHTAALAEKAALPSVEVTNEYYAAKKAEGKPPTISWEWMLVVGVFIGGLISSTLSGDRTSATVPPLWSWRFGKSAGKRLAVAFIVRQ